MPVFSEQIQALCDAVFSSKVERAAAVADVKRHVTSEKEDVAAFRDRVRSEQRAAADQMRQKLDQNQQDRKETVGAMIEGFDQVQRAFAEQCQAATRLWREMKERHVDNR